MIPSRNLLPRLYFVILSASNTGKITGQGSLCSSQLGNFSYKILLFLCRMEKGKIYDSSGSGGAFSIK